MNSNARKKEINLRTLGTGVMVLGAWVFIKFGVSYLTFGAQIYEEAARLTMVYINIGIWSVAAVDLLLRFYIGISAHSESKGKHKSVFYLIMAGFLVLLESMSVVGDIAAISHAETGLLSLIVTTLIDITSAVVLIELIVNAVGLRKLRKKEATA